MVVAADEQLVDDVAVVIGQRIQQRPRQCRGCGAEAVAKGDVLTSSARQHRHEPAVAGGDVAEVLAAGQLAVGHVEEVGVADQLAEQVPGADVGPVVDRVAAVAGEIDRHAAVTGNRQDVEQLLEIGTPGLAVSPGDGVGGPSPLFAFLAGRVVGAVERDGGRVVVQLIETEGEFLDDMADDGHDQGRPDPLEHAVERATEAVVVQAAEILGAKAEEVGGEEGRPFTDAIDRLACHEEIGEEDEQGGHGGEFGPRVVPGEMFTEDAPQLHSLDGAVEQWQGADVIGAEFEAVGLSVLARDDLPFGATWCGR